jgi:hypothetical protein
MIFKIPESFCKILFFAIFIDSDESFFLTDSAYGKTQKESRPAFSMG